ncbi:MAG TPA: hypothetical protein DCQ98_07835 [Planctomycetaceae bacterium]|nr:hypothetical protein [Planctomycetaceae bacterium]HRF00380.1 SLC13 family permease [Pirellulaceae bacterium]
MHASLRSRFARPASDSLRPHRRRFVAGLALLVSAAIASGVLLRSETTSGDRAVTANPIAWRPDATQEGITIPREALTTEAQGGSENRDAAASEAAGSSAAETPELAPAAEATAPEPATRSVGTRPLIILAIGIVTVLGLIIGFKANAFLALIVAAILVSLLAPGGIDTKIARVATAFGNASGNIAIVIGLAAIIGKCMLDSGAADRIVRTFLAWLGEKRSPFALLVSGFVLAIPVFFDTVFYLLVPLARSLHRRTGKEYLKYLLAIAGGGAITHTLVPPTPGPLLMASILGVDLGLMIVIGLVVAAPAALASLVFASIVDRRMPVPMRQLGNDVELAPPPDDRLPGLVESILPVALPVILIALSTVAVTIADGEDAAALRAEQVKDWSGWSARLVADRQADGDNPSKWLIDQPTLSPEVRDWLTSGAPNDPAAIDRAIGDLNRLLRDRTAYRESAFLGIRLPDYARARVQADNSRTKPVDIARMNRQLLEAAFPEFVAEHVWETPARRTAGIALLIGNANLALLVSTLIAMITLVRVRRMGREQLALSVESALMSGGVIILITAAGAAFGDMLQAAEIGPAIKERFGGIQGATSGVAALLLGFAIAAVLKVAQGSSTVAMIVGSGMMVAIVGSSPLGCHPVYLATAIGSGSLFGSWMNDSGFWIFAKMGGLTEGEALRSWTPALIVLSLTGLSMSLLLSIFLPLT